MGFNAKICHVLEMKKSGMRSTWTYKLGQNTISIDKEKHLGVVIKDNVSPEKHINKTVCDRFRMPGNTIIQINR